MRKGFVGDECAARHKPENQQTELAPSQTRQTDASPAPKENMFSFGLASYVASLKLKFAFE